MTFEEAKTYLLERAKALGVQLEVFGSHQRELTLKAHNGQLEEVKQAQRGGIGLRLVENGRVGYAYTEDLTPQHLDWALEEARQNAALQSETGGFLPKGRALGHQDTLGEGLSAPLEAKQRAALEFEANLRKDPRVGQVMFAGYTEREVAVSLGSTEGAAGTYRAGLASLMGSMVMREGSSLKQGWGADWSGEFHALDPGRTAHTLLERTGRLLGARPLKTGRYTAYLEPRAFAHLLLAFWSLWSGKAVLEGKSQLAGKLGARVASPAVTLVDDPAFPQGLVRRPFDAEGTPARRTVLVEAGVLRNYLTNSEAALKLGVENTGHAARDYRGTLGVAPTNLVVEPGAGVTFETGVIVSEVMGVHAGANPISGEFSLQALGVWVEDGEIRHPVENFAISGNFLELLERVVAVGAELEWTFTGVAVGTPVVAVADLSFAGA